MADPSTYRPAVGSIPESPGVYRFRDPNGRVIYVGKAKSLRQRLNSYFADVAGCTRAPGRWSPPRPPSSGPSSGTEVEALQLEYNWIKEFDPRFNVRYRDDKSYPAGRDAQRGVPAAAGHARGRRRRASATSAPTRTPGPSARRSTPSPGSSRPAPAPPASSSAPVRSAGPACSVTSASARPRASAGWTPTSTVGIVDDFCDFMAGKTDLMIKRLERTWNAAAEAMEYEKAARLRDDLGALKRADGEAGGRARATAPTPTSSPSPRTSSRRRSRSSTSAAAGCAGSAAGS